MRMTFLAFAVIVTIFCENQAFAATKYEAENATLSGGANKNTNHAGYSGTGFVDGFYNSTTTQVSYVITSATSGSNTITLHYSAGGGTSTNIGLYVNGTKIKNITCNGTTDWDTWADETETVTLITGNNTITYKAETASGSCINLDYLSIGGTDPCVGVQGGGNGLKGTAFGLNPPWSAGSEYCKATDGDINTFYDYSQANGGYTGLDLGSAKVITKIRYYPRGNSVWRTVGGKFQGSNTSSSSGFVDLYTIIATHAQNWNEVTISNSTGYRWVRYLSPDNGYGNIAEMEFYSTQSNTYEAENAALSGGANKNTNHAGYSGTGFVDGFFNSSTAQASFAVPASSAGRYTLTLHYSAGNGTSTNTGVYVNGTKIKNITCTATSGWDAWANETETVTLNAGNNTIAYKADASSYSCINLDYLFVEGGTQTYTLTLSTDGHGSVLPWGIDTIAAGKTVAINATPSEGYVFSNWTITAGTATIENINNAVTTVTTINSNIVVQANFVPTCKLSIYPDGNGTTLPKGILTLRKGAAQSIYATPKTGSTFFYWKVCSGTASIANSTSPKTTITVSSDNAVVQAVFFNSSSINYVSDLSWSQISNGWGPVEKDRSVNENVPGDGKALTLAGVTYTKGLGAHAASQINVPLNNLYSLFYAYIGIDDEVGTAGSAIFIVKVDGVEKYRSPVLTGSSATVPVSVDVSGGTTLSLITDPNGYNTFDHTDWADAKLVIGGGSAMPYMLNVINGATGTASGGPIFSSATWTPISARAPFGYGYIFKNWVVDENFATIADPTSPITTIRIWGSVDVTAIFVIKDIDGNEYTPITIGDRVWMKQNFCATKLNDGTSIALADNDNKRNNSFATPSWCNVNDISANISTYGALYNQAAITSNKLAPAGWHISGQADWESLKEAMGGSEAAATSLGSSDGFAALDCPGWNSSTGWDNATCWSLRNQDGNGLYRVVWTHSGSPQISYLYNNIPDFRSVRLVRNVLSEGYPLIPEVADINPYWQPAPTTNFYGSGDIDLDGKVTYDDMSLVQNMVNGLIPKNMRGDVDGDLDVTGNDAKLIGEYVQGIRQYLPGWWNQLSRVERENWVNNTVLKFGNLYNNQMWQWWFMCNAFAEQSSIWGTFVRNYGINTVEVFSMGQTVFNIPIFDFNIAEPLHMINAVLVGDDPTKYADWLKFEPQGYYIKNDINGECAVSLRTMQAGGGLSDITWADQSNPGIVVDKATYPNLVGTRPGFAPLSPSASNSIDMYNPCVIPSTPEVVLFEKQRDDMSKMHDLHLWSPSGEIAVGNLASAACYRLDSWYSKTENTVYLLLKSKPGRSDWLGNKLPGVFFATFNLSTQTLSQFTRLTSSTHPVWAPAGKIIKANDGAVHAFWIDDGYDDGVFEGENGADKEKIHWRMLNNTTWGDEQIVSSELSYATHDPSCNSMYSFDVVVSTNSIHLFYIDNLNMKIKETYYTGGAWTTAVQSDDAIELSAACGSDGSIHLAFIQRNANFPSWNIYNLAYKSKSSATSTWTIPEVLDQGYSMGSEANDIEISPMHPDILVQGAASKILVAWERATFPYGAIYSVSNTDLYKSGKTGSGSWSAPSLITLTRTDETIFDPKTGEIFYPKYGETLFYPKIVESADGTPKFSWWKKTQYGQTFEIQ